MKETALSSHGPPRPVPNADDVLVSADAAALVFVNQQAATRKDELWHAEVSGDNARAAAAMSPFQGLVPF